MQIVYGLGSLPRRLSYIEFDTRDGASGRDGSPYRQALKGSVYYIP